jgi:YidC/Oxa1 family membrane protein insertase
MDRTGIIVITICIIAFGFWFVQEQKYAEHAQQQAASNPGVVVANTNQTKTTSTTSTATTATPTTAIPVHVFDTNIAEQLIVITNDDARYTFTSRGGGLKSIQLLKYPETVSPLWKKEMATNAVATLNAHAPVPLLAILGNTNLVGNGNFTLTKINDGVRAEKTFKDGLVITKEFHISSNYLVDASVKLANTTAKTLAVPAQEWVVGTATPMGPDDNGAYVGLMWYDGKHAKSETESYFSTNTTILGIFHRTPKTEYRAGENNVVWAATHNQFFTIIAMPPTNEIAEQMVARPVDLAPFTLDDEIPTAPPVGIQTALVYPAQTLTANSGTERHIVFYAGPKEYRTLARIGEQFQNRADLVMQFGFFGFFAKALLLAMNWVHDITHVGYGWVIVLITIIIKVVFWPMTAASTRSMKRMQALAPEVKALKEKYKDDPQKFTQKQMELWKKNKVSPVSGCLPMFIQMPVFFGFYTMIRSAIELRGAHFLWVSDLSKPDTLFIIPGTHFPFNLLPLLMGATMLWQSHLQPPSPGMDPSQAKMMRYMPLFFMVFLYNYSAGLALYMTVSYLLTIVQTKITRMNQAVDTNTTPTTPGLTPPRKKKK